MALHRTRHFWALILLGTVMGMSLVAHRAIAEEAVRSYNIPPQELGAALREFARQSNKEILFSSEVVAHKVARALVGTFTVDAALGQLLAGSGLAASKSADGTILIVPANVDGATTRTVSAITPVSSSTDQEDGPLRQSGQTESTASLEDVIVTAQRRAEGVDKVPISITALSQSTMNDFHIQSFADLATIVPGLDAPPPAPVEQGSSDVAIRGIFSGGNAPTTAIYIDETPIAARELSGAGPSGSFHPDIFDLDRVEVLRGPQGTLFGSSAMGGAIRFITPQPNLDQASGYAKAEFSYTEHGDPSYAVGVAYGAPVVQGLAGFRVSGWFHSDGGFIDAEDPFTGQIVRHNTNSSNAYTIRPAFTLVPTDGLTITPAVFIQHQHSDGPAEYWATLIPNSQPGEHTTGALLPQPLSDDIKVPSLSIKYEFSGLSLQSDTSYLDRWYDNFDDTSRFLEAVFDGGQPLLTGIPNSFASESEQKGGTKAWQQEIRLTSPDTGSRFHWIFGAYYRHAQETLSQLITPDLSPITQVVDGGQASAQYFGVPDYVLNGQILNSYTWFRTVDEQRALFGEASLDITARFKASAGVRIEHSAVVQQQEVVAGPLNGIAYSRQVLPDQVQNPITPRFALTYQYTDQDMVYATASKGYRAGGGNSATSLGNSLCNSSLKALGLSSVPASFNSDSLWSYEIGAKDSLFGGRLAVQASVFYINWTNIQSQVYLPSCSENFTTNQGKAVSQGFDLQVAAVPLAGLKLSANVGYTDAYYPKAAYGAPVDGVQPLLNGAGDKLSLVLPWTASARAEYTRDIGMLWENARSYVRAEYRWLDSMPKGNPQVTNYDPGVGPYPNQAYGILGFRVGVIRGGLDVSAFVDNVTNSDPRLSYAHYLPGDPLYYADALRPLTVGLTAQYRF